MDQEQAFLEAIRRRPGSFPHRLVYADWLTDRGDPRGEFIRFQVEAGRLPDGSPRRLELEARADDLLLAHEDDWLGPLLGAVANWEWRGGLLDWVTVPADAFLAEAPRWLPALPLLGVQLRKARPHVAALARCEQLAHLSGLYLGDNDLSDDDLEVLLRSPHLKRVRSLYLQSNLLGERAGEVVAQTPNLPRLRELNLGHNRLGDEAVVALARSPRLSRLRHLNLTMTALEEAGLVALAGSRLLPRLHDLMIGMNMLLPQGSLAALAGAPAFAGLRSLSYEMNQPGDADVAALAGSPHATGLRRLSLDSYETLSDAALRALATGPSLGRLRSLSFGSGPWGPAGARALGRSRTLTALRSLHLTQGNERARGVPEALLGQPLVRRLRRLALSVTHVGKEGLAALASHPRPLRLRQLDLPLEPDMGAAWEALLAGKMLPELTALSLSDPPPGAVRALLEPGRLPELRRLTLYGLPGLDEFQELLDSPLLRRLHELRVKVSYEAERKHGREVLRRLSAAWNTPALRRLGLLWSLSPADARVLAASAPPPALTTLEVGVLHLKAEGMAALAGWPGLRRLRHLHLRNASANEVAGLEALAESPHVGPLLRVEIHNGSVPDEAVPALRRRFGGRFAIGGRLEPRTITLGGWHQLVGDGED
jgi:uncharacterized protein (TIGR02996 family)